MTRHRIVVVLPDDVLPLDYAIPVHIFGREASEAYDLVTVSVGGGAVPVAGGTWRGPGTSPPRSRCCSGCWRCAGSSPS
jgi:hypothetical protein